MSEELTEKERITLLTCLDRLAFHEREDVGGAILKCNSGSLTYEEVSALEKKIQVPGHSCVYRRCGRCEKCLEELRAKGCLV